MTEDEAKTKWCPQARVAAPIDSEAAGTAGNRWCEGDPRAEGSHYRCIGSDCMAWRWTFSGYGEPSPDGYCGLAGYGGAESDMPI